jgi:PhnB protein
MTLRTITPRIVATDAAGLITFLKNVFDATGELREGAPAQIAIGDSGILVSEAKERAAFPAFLYVYVKDTDATYKRALRAGAVSVEEVWDTPYGDRRGMVRDPWDNLWQIATRATK